MNSASSNKESIKNSLRFLYVAEVVGKTGVYTVRKLLPSLRQKKAIDFVIVNASNATNGSGIGKAHAMTLRKLDIDIVTTGESAFFKKDILEIFPKSSWLLRPANYPQTVPGHGYKIYRNDFGNIAVIQLLGQAGFQKIHLENPFVLFDSLYEQLKQEAKIIIVEFRAPTTAEKRAFICHAEGRASAVIGSFAKVITADAAVSANGTASICDAGRTGSINSVCGMEPSTKIREYISGVRTWAREAEGPCELQGCIFEIDKTGKALSIEAIRIPFKGISDEGNGNS